MCLCVQCEVAFRALFLYGAVYAVMCIFRANIYIYIYAYVCMCIYLYIHIWPKSSSFFFSQFISFLEAESGWVPAGIMMCYVLKARMPPSPTLKSSYFYLRSLISGREKM